MQMCEDEYNKINKHLGETILQEIEISKSDIAELKSLQKPPKTVKLIMEAVCILLGIEPVLKVSKKTGEEKLSYWLAS